jgi:hypothetical protein
VTWWQKKQPAADVEDPPPGAVEARKARTAAESGLREAREQWPLVRGVASAMRRLRAENHFAELIAETMRRRGDV